jgi:hypothetical protein
MLAAPGRFCHSPKQRARGFAAQQVRFEILFTSLLQNLTNTVAAFTYYPVKSQRRIPFRSQVMQSKKSVQEESQVEGQRKLQEERQKLIVNKVKLPNGATFTILRPVVAG